MFGGSSLVAQWGEDPSLSLLWLALLLWYWFDPWPWNFCLPWVQPKAIKINWVLGKPLQWQSSLHWTLVSGSSIPAQGHLCPQQPESRPSKHSHCLGMRSPCPSAVSSMRWAHSPCRCSCTLCLHLPTFAFAIFLSICSPHVSLYLCFSPSEGRASPCSISTWILKAYIFSFDKHSFFSYVTCSSIIKLETFFFFSLPFPFHSVETSSSSPFKISWKGFFLLFGCSLVLSGLDSLLPRNHKHSCVKWNLLLWECVCG